MYIHENTTLLFALCTRKRMKLAPLVMPCLANRFYEVFKRIHFPRLSWEVLPS